LDRTLSTPDTPSEKKPRAGCKQLFAAVARARPRLHCFGHIHEGWGAKLVAWREQPTDDPLHLTDIDNGKSVVVETLAALQKRDWDTPTVIAQKAARSRNLRTFGYRATDHSARSAHPIVPGKTTLFVNAAIESATDLAKPQLPWIIDIDLPAADK
jgi:hypothetical protein